MRRACRLEPWFSLRFTLGGVVPVGTTRPMASLNSSQVSSLGARASPLVTAPERSRWGLKRHFRPRGLALGYFDCGTCGPLGAGLGWGAEGRSAGKPGMPFWS